MRFGDEKVTTDKDADFLKSYLHNCTEVQPLKEGGQRSVYRAVHPVFGSVVIKHSQYGTPSTLDRLSREATLLRSITNPCFPKMHEILIEASTSECVMTESYVSGVELTGAIDQFRTENEIIFFLRSIIGCMSQIWDRRIVHRDLKPANILITDSGRPIVIDFGIARFLDEASLTRTIASMGPGTPAYAAPEQLINRKREIGIRADFFALGVICLELLHGRHAYDPEWIGGESIPHNLIAGRYCHPEKSGKASPAFCKLLKRLVQVEPYLRFRDTVALKSFIDSNWEVAQ